MSRVLIVNADDFGRSPGICRGIERAAKEGVVRSTTVMINLPGAPQAVIEARGRVPRLAWGLHLNITHGEACSPAMRRSQLVDAAGCFKGPQALLAALDRLDHQTVAHEWRAQADALLGCGAELDHLDSHHHAAYFSPWLSEFYFELAAELSCGVRPPCPMEGEGSPLGRDLPPQVRHYLCQQAPQVLESAGLQHPDHFVTAFFGSGVTAETLHGIIASLPQGVTELMTHPGEVDPALRQHSGYCEPRRVELDLLTAPELHSLLEQNGIRLACYADAWEADD
jgi:predicted glycoside hydrolase/deacetylase ChbG (UPF0249 family)